MKIDLHCHTKKTKSGDPVTRNVTKDLFEKKIREAGVDLIAITNHNAFDLKQYEELSGLNICTVWPGIELDVKPMSGGKCFHVLVVGDPNEAEAFSKAVELLVDNTNADAFNTSVHNMLNAFKELNAIFIPHFAKKPGAIPDEDCLELKKRINPGFLFLEPSNLRTVGICAFHGSNMIIGSDVQDWSKYEKSTFAELRIPISNFNQLTLLAQRDQSVVQHLLDQKKSSRYKVSPVPNESFEIDFYNDVNIIFGEKGTGKSRILDSLEESLKAEGKSCIHYRGAKRDEELAQLLDKSDMKQSCANLNVSDCASEIVAISNWSEPAITPLKDYFDWVRTGGNDDAKIKMKLVKMTSFGIPDTSILDEANKDSEHIEKAVAELEQVDVNKYLSKKDGKSLMQLINRLNKATKNTCNRAFMEIYSIKLANHAIDTIKKQVAGCKGSKAIPSQVGFEQYAQSRIMLKKALGKIVETLNTKEHIESTYLGPLDGKGDIYIKSRWRFPAKDSDTTEYTRFVTYARNLARLFTDAEAKVLNVDFKPYLTALNQEIKDRELTSLDKLVGTSRFLSLEDGKEYEPSNGEKGILLLRKKLNQDASVYLIDEPELGMGNSFIEDSIRPKLIELGRRCKTVIVATHNANIAVRCLPYRSVYREHVNGNDYRTYIGNPFVDKLTDITNPNNEIVWTEVSLRTLEGGQEAFDERGYIYDSAAV